MLYPLTNDYVFKSVFSHKEIQEDFLNSFIEFYDKLNINADIKSINAEKLLMAPHISIKEFYGDLIIVLDNNILVSLEMYNGFEEKDLKKSLCYVARIYGNQLKKGEEYSSVRKVIGITLFKDETYKMNSMLEDYELVDKVNKIKIEEGVELILVDIDNEKTILYNEDMKFIKYLKIFRSVNYIEMNKHSGGDEMLEKTIAYAKEFTSDPDNQNLIDHFESAVRNAKRIAESKGKTEGIEIGKIEGIKLGKIDIAQKLLNLGVAKSIVQKSTGLSLEELNNLVVS